MSKLNIYKKSVLLISALVVTMVFTTTSIARDEFKNDGARQFNNDRVIGLRTLRQLELTEEQSALVRELLTAQRETAQDLRERSREVSELIEAGNVDQAAEIAASIARERVTNTVTNKQNFQALLTSEQLTALESMKDEASERGGRRQGNNRSRN